MDVDRIDIRPPDDEEAPAADDDPMPEPPIEPGQPSAENVLFVLLGVLLALAVVARLFLLFT